MAVSASYVYCFSLYAFYMNNIICVNYILQNCLVGCIFLSLSNKHPPPPPPPHTHILISIHTHTHTHTTQAYTHIHLNNISPLMSQHSNIWSHQNLNFWTHPFPNTHPCKNVPPLIRSYFPTNQTPALHCRKYTLTVTWAELLINPHQHNMVIHFWQVCVFGGGVGVYKPL